MLKSNSQSRLSLALTCGCALFVLSGCESEDSGPQRSAAATSDRPAKSGSAQRGPVEQGGPVDGGQGGSSTVGEQGGTGSWFVDVTDEIGVRFQQESGGTGKLYMPEIMAGGAAVFDFDNDDRLDLYFVNGHSSIPDGFYSDGPESNVLYRQLEDGTFEDVTKSSGLGDRSYGMGAAVGDIDNDGDLDVYLSNFGRDRLYRNNGDGTFSDITDRAGVEVSKWSCSAAFFDFDLDGYLDIFVTQYVAYSKSKNCSDRAGRPDYCGPKAFGPLADVLLKNNGDGTFTDVSKSAGITQPAAGLGVVVDDFNEDGRPDVYVANDAYNNHLWINQGDGTFVDEGLVAGAAYNVHGQAEAGMGVVVADFDGDLGQDLFVTHLNQESNTLYRRIPGVLAFSDETGAGNLAASSMNMTGFGVTALDAELDGDLDIMIANGRVVRGDPVSGSPLAPPWDRFPEHNLFYLNDGRGKFQTAGREGGEIVSRLEITRCLTSADLDADGDLDVVLTNIEGPARVYRNEAARGGHWLMVRAVDPTLNREAIGARVVVSAGGRKWVRSITRTSGYLCATDARAHFGLGVADGVDDIHVQWPGGAEERFEGSPADRVITVVRGRGTSAP